MSDLGVFLGGEGPNELGSYSGHPAYHDDSQPGVLQVLLGRVRPTGWAIVGAVKWSKIRKLRAHGPSPREERNVRALLLHAKEAGANVVAFVRDSDGHTERVHQLRAGIIEAAQTHPNIDVIGGAAEPVLEAWLLAMLGAPKTEALSKSAAESRYAEKVGVAKSTAEAVAIAEAFVLDELPTDAKSLRAWLNSARSVFERRLPSPVRATP